MASTVAAWPMIRFDQLLRRVERKILLDDATSYNCAGVRWYGNGAFNRETLLGMQIKRKQQWVLQTGDVVYNKLFAWKGAFAIASAKVDGCIVSDKFPTYAIDPTVVDLRYLGYYFRTPQLAQQADNLSKGAAAISKLTLNPPQFWDLTIPLPPLDDQRRIVARIEELAARIAEAQGLRKEAMAEAERLLKNASTDAFGAAIRGSCETVTLGEIGEIRAGVTLGRVLNGPTVRLPYLRVANVQDGHLNLKHIKEVEVLPGEVEKWQLRAGDILLTEGGDWDKLGRGTVWSGEIPNCIHQNHIFRIRVDQTRFIPRLLARYLGSQHGKDYFQAAAKQTTNLASINQRQLRAFSIPVLTMGVQERILTHIDDMQTYVDTLKHLQAESAAELDALLPSLLDKAFRGEL